MATFVAVMLINLSSLISFSELAAAAGCATALRASILDAVGLMIPVEFVSFLYHNVVTSVPMRVQCDLVNIQSVIIFGSCGFRCTTM